jgi:hypothetical protein
MRESKALLELLAGLQEVSAEPLLRILDGLSAQFCQQALPPIHKFQLIADMHGLVDRIEALLAQQDPFDEIISKMQQGETKWTKKNSE